MVLGKGKEKVVDGDGKGKGKRKLREGNGDDDKTGRRKRKNPGVLQFFEDEAYQVEEDEDSSDESFFDEDDFTEEELSSDKHGTGKATQLPFVPKVEEMSDDELERKVKERYGSGSSLVTYSEDWYDRKSSIEGEVFFPSAMGQIWKVKCTMGRERYSTFCLMQKFAEMDNLGRKLLIISACALDNVKGYIFVEADKQNDVYEACKGLSTIYVTRMCIVTSNEISRLLLTKSMSCGISVGIWARVKNGRYKGDIAQVAAVDKTRKKVTVKLVPRIDLKAMADKFGGGVTARRNAIPPQRLISPSELEDFRPLIQTRRDRDTNEMFEILDGMMLKDGYLYKKIAMDSLSYWGITPSDDELAKFEPGKKVESANLEWISQLLDKKKEVEVVKKDKGGEKSGGKSGGKWEGSSSFSIGNGFEVEDLVFIGRKDFGIVISLDMEKDNSVKIMKESSGVPSVVAVKRNELKVASFDKKLFAVSDQHSNSLTVNDSVRILEGPLKDRQGIVKRIYKGVLFLFDEAEEENNGYLCVKANICEKINLSVAESTEQGIEADAPVFADRSSSPQTPLSPDQSFQERDNKSNFSRRDDAVFSVGQLLRIRIGPLKGYRCRVLAVRRSDVTVKLDSMHKILTVKFDHLSEVRERNSAIGQGEDHGSFKPFSFLGSQDGASDWMDGAKLQTEDNGWNAPQTTERTSWSAFPSSNFSLSKESGSGNSGDADAKKDADSEDSSWQKKTNVDQDSSWGSTAVNRKNVPEDGPTGCWGAQGQGISGDAPNDSWGKATKNWSTGADASRSKAAWGQGGVSSGEHNGNSINAGADPDKPEKHSWKNDAVAEDKLTECSEQNKDVASGSMWNRTNPDGAGCGSSWGKQEFKSSRERPEGALSGTKNEVESTWGAKHEEESAWNKSDGGSTSKINSWGQQPNMNVEDKGKGWNIPNVENIGRSGSWNKPNSDAADWGSSCSKQEFKPSCENTGGAFSEAKKDGGSSWSKNEGGSALNKTDDGSSWNNESSKCKLTQKSSWGQQLDTNAEDKGQGLKIPADGNVSGGGWGKGGSSWSKSEEGSALNKTEDESSWNNESSKCKQTQKSLWGQQLETYAEDKGQGWKIPADGNVSGGSWGKGGWSTSGANETETTKNSWSSGSTWNSGNNFRGSDNQDNNGGRGGSWNGDRGDRGRGRFGGQGFRGRGSERGGFRGSDSQDDTSNDNGRGGMWNGRGGRGDRGGFRGRGGSDRGGFGGRGGRDGDGFRGRGGRDGDGFRGRGRGRGGNWRNGGDDSNVDCKSYSWGQGSNNDTGAWKGSSSGGSWNKGNSDNNQPSWNSSQPKWGSSNAGDAKIDSGNGGWGSSNAGNARKDSGTGGWGGSNAGDSRMDSGTGGWASSAGDAKKDSGNGGWGSSNAGDARKDSGTGGWGSSNAGDARKDSGTGGWGSSDAGEARKDSGTSGWGSSNSGDARKDSGTGGWGSSNAGDSRKDSGTGGWGSSAGDAKKNSGNGGWGSTNDGDARKDIGTGSPNAGNAPTGAWGSSNAGHDKKDIQTGAWGASNAFGKEVPTNWNKPSASLEAGQSKESNKDKGPSDAWGSATTGSQAGGSNKEEGPSDDAWGKAAKNSWASSTGSDKGGW